MQDHNLNADQQEPTVSQEDNKNAQNEPMQSQSVEAEMQLETDAGSPVATPLLTRVNQVVTSIISGVFTSLCMLIGFFGLSHMGITIETAANSLSLQGLMIAIVIFALSLCIGQTLDAYLTKLVEKDHFSGTSFKVYKNISSQVMLLILSIPFLFLSLGLSAQVALLFLANYLIFSNIIYSQILFFGFNFRQLGSLFGLFLAATGISFLIFNLSSEIGPILLLLTPIIVNALRELGAQVVDGLSKFEI
jgi:hypothetical protein